MILNKDLESTVSGLYVGGDVTGHFRGAMQSMISGILIARSILKKDHRNIKKILKKGE